MDLRRMSLGEAAAIQHALDLPPDSALCPNCGLWHPIERTERRERKVRTP